MLIRRVVIGTESMVCGLNLFTWINKILEQGLEHLFVTSIAVVFIFFYKTELE